MKTASRITAIVTSSVSALAWLILCLWTAICLLGFWSTNANAVSAVQQSAASSIAITQILAAFAIAWAIDAVCTKVANTIEKFTT